MLVGHGQRSIFQPHNCKAEVDRLRARFPDRGNTQATDGLTLIVQFVQGGA